MEMVAASTWVDLAGNPAPERLQIHTKGIWVDTPAGGDHRRWWFDQIKEFRLEALVGSCFLQAKVDGRWIDVMRFSGGVDDERGELVSRLSALCLASRSPWTPDLWEETMAAASKPAPNGHSGKWRRIAALVRPLRMSVLLLLALSLLAVGVDVVPPLLQRALVDRVLQVEMPAAASEQVVMLLVSIVLGLLLVRLGATIVAVGKGWIASRVGTKMTADLRSQLVEKLGSLPLAFHDRKQVGVLMSQVAYDTETMHTLIHHITSGLLLQSLQLVGIGVMLFVLNPKLAAITLAPMPLIVGGSWYFTRHLQPLHQHYWEAVGRQASALMGMLGGIRVVKAFAQEDREVKRFCQSSAHLRDARMTVDVSTAAFTACMGFLFVLGSLAVWYIGGRDVLAGRMTVGSLMAFLAYLAMFYAPLTSISESTTWFAGFFGTVERMGDLLDTPSEATRSADESPMRRPAGAIEFQGVTFGYDKAHPVLRDIDLAIRPGEMVGVLGHSGSGKSTLVNLIARLYEVDAGRILLDGTDIRQFDPRQFRRQIGIVPQEPFLFRGTVADNISYGNAQSHPEQILMAAKRADAHGFVMQMPLAYETQLGEGGAGLSGGERQRLSIARALICDPTILILDEATANVDAEAERTICDALRRLARRQTTIVIAHRLSTLRDANRLLVFDGGRLVEQGTHNELLALGGVYARLAKVQRAALPYQHPDHPAAPLEEETAEAEASWLEPDQLAMDAQLHGSLRVIYQGREYDGVHAVRAFPATCPRQFISLVWTREPGKAVELGLLRDLQRWPRAVQDAVERSLRRRYLLHPIHEIRQIRANGGLLKLSVVTDRGPVNLEMERRIDGPQPFGSRGMLLVDTRGNDYVVPDCAKLPVRQRKLLALYFGEAWQSASAQHV